MIFFFIYYYFSFWLCWVFIAVLRLSLVVACSFSSGGVSTLQPGSDLL